MWVTQRVVSSLEFSEWCAFYDLEPWGGGAENWRAAMLAQTVANTAGKTLKRPAKLADFLPVRRKEAQTRGEVIRMLEAASGGDRGK